MTWKGKHPVVTLVRTTYQTGVTLTKEAMNLVESQIQRLPSLSCSTLLVTLPTYTVKGLDNVLH